MVDKINKSTKDLTNVANNSIIDDTSTPKRKRGRPKNSELSNVKLALQAKKRLDNKKKSTKDLTDVSNKSIIKEQKPTTKKVGRPKNSELSNVKLALQAKKD